MPPHALNGWLLLIRFEEFGGILIRHLGQGCQKLLDPFLGLTIRESLEWALLDPAWMLQSALLAAVFAAAAAAGGSTSL